MPHRKRLRTARRLLLLLVAVLLLAMVALLEWARRL